MPKRVLITGGAGFIGSHLADNLIQHGWEVRLLDNLSPQVHGDGRQPPAWLNPAAELVVGDVRDPAKVERSLGGVEAVVHLAAAVGVGQSMYEVASYTSINNLGTAVLLEQLIKRPVRRLIVASSMSVYGEGLYRNGARLVEPRHDRSLGQLRAGQWELQSEEGTPLEPVPTPESKQPSLASIYALSKYDQERMCLLIGRAYRIPTVALRLFNVYGPRQALSNPYTGVLAIFAARLLNDHQPLIFEDGNQRRDFVSVHDVARAFRLALESDAVNGHVLNIGSGESRTVNDVARQVAGAMGKAAIEPAITGRYRVGDVRHCFADVSLARRLMDFHPSVRFAEGIHGLAEWLQGQVAMDKVAQAKAELEARGLTI